MYKKFKNNQDGLVAITVTIIVLVILSTMLIGFAQQSRRERRSALDRRLSSQAFYAAESGLALARRAIDDGFSGQKSECGSGSGFTAPFNNANILAIDNSAGVAVTCLLIDQLPTSLEYNTANGKAQVTRVKTSGAQSIVFSWKPITSDGSFGFATGVGNDRFEPDSSSVKYSVIRLSITDLSQISSGRSGLNNNTFTVYLYPKLGGAGSINYDVSSPTRQGQVVEGSCSSSNGECIATISGLAGKSDLALFFSSTYRDANVKIQAKNGVGELLAITGSQALVDSTGTASDVLRRVQARVPLKNAWTVDAYSIKIADDLCKQYSISNIQGTGCEF